MQRGDLLCNFGVIVLKRLNVFLVPTSLDLIFQGGSWHPKWPAGIKGWPILKADTVIIVGGMKKSRWLGDLSAPFKQKHKFRLQ